MGDNSAFFYGTLVCDHISLAYAWFSNGNR